MSSAFHLIEQGGRFLRKQGTIVVGHLALDKKGKPAKPNTRRAIMVDAMGALYKAAGVAPETTYDDKALSAALAHIDYAALLLFRKGIVPVNDEHGFDAVMQCYRQAWASITKEAA